MDPLASWYALDLGDAVLAHAPLARIKEAYGSRAPAAGPAGIFVRYDSEGRLHCEVTVFFTPALGAFAREFGASPVPRPARAGLELLAGDAGPNDVTPTMARSPFDVRHALRLLRNHEQLTGRALLPREPGETDEALAQRLYAAPFVVLSHGTGPDPLFNYANLAAQRAFERSWDEFVGLPSRLSAQAPVRAERERLLAQVTARGFIDDYSGVRVAKSGRRFRILKATVWNLTDEHGAPAGQAATFADVEPCD